MILHRAREILETLSLSATHLFDYTKAAGQKLTIKKDLKRCFFPNNIIIIAINILRGTLIETVLKIHKL